MPLLTPSSALQSTAQRDRVGKVFAPAGYGSELMVLGRRDDEYPDYPARLVEQDTQRDMAKMLKARQAGIEQGQVGYMGEVMLTDDDIRYQLEKAAIAEDLKFQKFISDNHPRATYADVEQFKKVMPDWYKQRIAVFQEKMDFLTQLGMDKILGIWDRAGWERLYNAISGKYLIPDGFHQLLDPPTTPDGQATSDNVIPGMYSFTRYSDTNQQKKHWQIGKANARNLAVLKIPGFDANRAWENQFEKPEEGTLWDSVFPTFAKANYGGEQKPDAAHSGRAIFGPGVTDAIGANYGGWTGSAARQRARPTTGGSTTTTTPALAPGQQS